MVTKMEDFQTVNITVCKPGITINDKIYLGQDWKKHEYSIDGYSGIVLARKEEERPDWADMVESFMKAAGKESPKIVNQIVRGFWLLEIQGRVVVACFSGAEKYLDFKYLDALPKEFEVESDGEIFRQKVIEHMEFVVAKNQIQSS